MPLQCGIGSNPHFARRELMHTKHYCLVVLLAVAAGWVGGRLSTGTDAMAVANGQVDSAKALTAQEFRLTDESGKLRGRLWMGWIEGEQVRTEYGMLRSDMHGPMLTLYDPLGNAAVELLVADGTGEIALLRRGDDGTIDLMAAGAGAGEPFGLGSV
jgi:hypothetical protein